MRYKILHNQEYNLTFLLEVKCFDEADHAESGTTAIGEIEFTGRAKKMEKLLKLLEESGYNSQIFESYTQQIATAVHKATIQSLKKK